MPLDTFSSDQQLTSPAHEINLMAAEYLAAGGDHAVVTSLLARLKQIAESNQRKMLTLSCNGTRIWISEGPTVPLNSKK